jgi:hypothetical protein
MNLMLEFGQRHAIILWVEIGEFNFKEGIRAGVERLRGGLARYRYTVNCHELLKSRFVAVAGGGATK